MGKWSMEIPEFTSCHGHTQVTITYKAMLWMPWKLAVHSILKSHIAKGKKGRDVVRVGTKYPVQCPTSKRDVTKTISKRVWRLKSEEFKPHSGYPLTWVSAPGRQAPIASGFENQWGLILGEAEGYRKQRLNSYMARTQFQLLRGSSLKIVWPINEWRYTNQFKGYAGRVGFCRSFL